MRLFAEKYRVLIWITIVLVAGFLATSVAGYQTAREAMQRAITEQTLPLAGDRIHAEIQAQVQRPATIASMMAGDTFVRAWLSGGESDTDAIVRYLSDIRQRYSAASAFLVSDRTRNYYYAGGVLRQVRDNDPRDAWFFRRKEDKRDATTEVDIDRADHDALTIFINHRIEAADGSFVGVAGIGLKAGTLMQLLDSYQQRFGQRVSLVDAQGRVVLAGTGMPHEPLESMPGIGGMARQLLSADDKPVQMEYLQDGAHVLVSARAIPELDWHLLVERNAADEARPVRHAFALSLAIGAGASLLVLGIVLATVRRYRQQLEMMAGTDTLTGLPNRQAFEIMFVQATLDASRTGRPLSGILFDIDFLKQVNDNYGHQAGDAVLKTIAQIARGMLRESDTVARSGGEEFIVLLKECSLEQAAAVAEKLRFAVDRHDFSALFADRQITISLGVAQYFVGESAASFFSRADQALNKAKANGRNRLQVALIDSGGRQVLSDAE